MTAGLKIVRSEKHCPTCGETKSSSEFYPHKVHGLSHRCKLCHRAHQKAHKYTMDKGLMRERATRWRQKVMADPVRRAKLREKKNRWNRSERYYDSYYKKRFGISLAEVTSMLARQNGLCANLGCGVEIAIGKSGNAKKACVDHSHSTGKVRAMLCTRCNTTLGHIENNQTLVPGLMDYLSKHKS